MKNVISNGLKKNLDKNLIKLFRRLYLWEKNVKRRHAKCMQAYRSVLVKMCFALNCRSETSSEFDYRPRPTGYNDYIGYD